MKHKPNKVNINSQLLFCRHTTRIPLDQRRREPHTDSLTLQLNCSRPFYNLLLSVSVSTSCCKVLPPSDPLGPKHEAV